MSDVHAAQAMRRRIHETAGPVQMPARQLRDAFGRKRLTDKARREIDGALLNEGLATRPSILVVDADELITVFVAERQAVAAAPGPRRGTFWGEYRRMPAWLQLLVPVMAVILIASVASGGSSSKNPDRHAQQARIATNPSTGQTDSSAEARRQLRAERRRAAAARRQAKREAAAEKAAERRAEREREARAARRRERRREEQQQLEQAVPPAGDSGGSSDSGGSGCDQNYTGACVPTDQGDVDCGDIAETDFNSVGSDPDRLDADNDGIACES
ncbi:MAG: hypothetical protein ACJ768_23050 [Gaiellaceae bacterium]